jgi:hypothetical protein
VLRRGNGLVRHPMWPFGSHRFTLACPRTPGAHPLSTRRSPQPSRASRSAEQSASQASLGAEGTAAAFRALFRMPARRCTQQGMHRASVNQVKTWSACSGRAFCKDCCPGRQLSAPAHPLAAPAQLDAAAAAQHRSHFPYRCLLHLFLGSPVAWRPLQSAPKRPMEQRCCDRCSWRCGQPAS